MRRDRPLLVLRLVLLSLRFAVETIALNHAWLSFAIRLWFHLQGFRLSKLITLSQLFQYVEVKDDKNSACISQEISPLAVDSLFAFDEAGIVRLQPDEASFPQLAVVDVVICLSGKHSLHEVLDIAEDDAKPFAGRGGACQWLDLDALHDRSQRLSRRTIEYCFEGALIDAGSRVACHHE